MSAFQEILKTKMCRDTAGLVLEYLSGNTDYWKGEYKKTVKELNDYFKTLPIEMIIESMKEYSILNKKRRKSNNIKKHIGKIIRFHPTDEILFEVRVDKITDKQKLVLTLPTGKKKYAKIIKAHHHSFIYFTHRGRRFIFTFYDTDTYYTELIKNANEREFLSDSIRTLRIDINGISLVLQEDREERLDRLLR
jgi:hypothetical protein